GAENADCLAPERRLPSVGILTDGVWVWPSDLAYYVAVYHCRIPEGFLQYVTSSDWRPPDRKAFDVRSFFAKYRQAFQREVVGPPAEQVAPDDRRGPGSV